MKQTQHKTKHTDSGVKQRPSSVLLRAKPHAKRLSHHGKRIAVKGVKAGAAVVKTTHRHIAKRPHEHLRSKLRWYDAWHDKKYHSHMHTYILVLYSLVVGVAMFGAYEKAFALSDLVDSFNFSNSSDYSFDSGIELPGSDAQFKAQNYANDANTAALYHMDESTGSTLTDSSSNGNNGTVSNATFSAGNLNNALSLNGSTSSVSVPDSPSLSLSQKNTIEAWTQFSSNFSAGSDTQRQTIVDKGDYQLYYDNETGKVVYELADKNANSWSLAGGNDTNGSWDQNGKRAVNAIVKMGSDYYYGIGNDTGDAEVWKWDGSSWTQIGGGPSSIHNSWDANTYEGVYSLTTDGTNLYAGLGLSSGDGEVWKWNGSSWSKIGGDSVNGGWTNYAEQVWTLDYFGGKLYAGIGNSANDAEVWEWDGSSWTKIGGDSVNSGWTANFERVAALTDDGTHLYAGLGVSANDAEVWEWDGSSWTKIGGDSINSGWTTNYETVDSLRYFGGNLYAGLGDSSGDAEVWKWGGTSWTKIGGDGVNSGWGGGYEQVASLAYDGTNLYAGLGTSNGDGEVWKWGGSSWTKIGGDGDNGSWATNQGDIVNTLLYDNGKLYSGTYDSGGAGLAYTWDGSSWTQIGGDYVNNSWGFYGFSAVQVMQAQGGYLYAGMGNTTGAAAVFRYDGSTWNLIGGQGINGSWDANTYEYVYSMASYDNHLIVGLGNTASGSTADGEVWEWDGSSWTKIGGNGVNSSWQASSHYGEVDSMASYNGYLYAGLGAGSRDGEVWRWDGSTWTQIGGDSLNGGWTTYAENVYSLAVYDGKLIAGLGRSNGDGEVWQWDGSGWTKIGGDSTNGSWDSSTYQDVESLMPYGDKLYAGMGYATGSATLWQYDGSTWTEVGGDDINGSWTTGTYERVKTIAVYNGDIYAGLGNSTGDGEVWRLSDGTWSKIGGNSINSGWTNGVEEIESFSPYKGKLYAGTGLSTNVDALVWSWGNNAYLESSKSSFDTNWHHVAATYDGANMKLYVDGALDSQTSANVLLPDSSRPLLIGSSYGGREYGKAVGTFNGKIDELRISNDARSGFNAHPYSSGSETITLANAVRASGVWHWDNFTTSETTNGGNITYRLSSDNGATWLYWDGSAWSASNSTADANNATTVDAHVSTFPVTFDGLKWQAVLTGNGDQRVTLNSVTTYATSDLTEPSVNAGTISAYHVKGGAALASNDWTNGGSPDFTWAAAADSDSGIKGYCLYVGTDNTADPATTKGLLGTSPTNTGGHCQFMVTGTELDLATSGYLNTALTTSDSPYYLSIKAIDNAGNVISSMQQFHFRFDNTPPANPGYITSPSGFINTKAATLTWATSGPNAPVDNNSGLAGMQYRIGNSGTWYGDSHSGTGDSTDLLANDGSYTMQSTPDFDNLAEGINNIYFRTWDNAGNVTTSFVSAALKVNTSGAPSEPQNVNVSPSSNTENSFAFTWSPPTTFVGDVNNLTYCYTVNTLPSSSTCSFTTAGASNLSPAAYATQPGENTFYIAAKDESGNINYSSYASANFTANTPSPGMPLNMDIVDVSIKSTNNWRLALTWDSPTYTGAGIASYKIYRSTDNTNFTFAGSSTSTTYIDAGLTQQTYYYQVKACDSTNNCSATGSVVSALPTGKFTSPANLVAEPVVSNITTRKARIDWSTDRNSDSKIAIGTKSGDYSASEIGNSDQVSAHEIDLDNLAAGTTYYFVAKWTDGDGNTGVSQEYQFTTSPAPSLEEITTTKVSLTAATIQFTSKDSSKIIVYFGKSSAFGGVQTVNTSLSKSTYNVDLNGLDDGVKYFYKLVSFDADGNSYDGSIFSFTTPPRPRISNLRFQPVKGVPTSTQKVTWDTNVPSTSGISYAKAGGGSVDSLDTKMVTQHAIIIRGLQDNSEYTLIAQSRDTDGNLAASDTQSFHTALDTRPPIVSNVTVEPSIHGVGAQARGQVVVSWHTDEPATSQVAYAEGAHAADYSSRTAEDSGLSTEHVVIVTDLPTSKVYSLEPVSKDAAGNIAYGQAQSAIIGHASDSVMTIILNTLKNIFGL
ncbi:MAG: hypothetical protein H6797_00315 [Candidatus Nomurabacteria bacterium]|nr:MAG: hypothetical protein H6797_00315 [Candidatus Nomurabacteria bacterium]